MILLLISCWQRIYIWSQSFGGRKTFSLSVALFYYEWVIFHLGNGLSRCVSKHIKECCDFVETIFLLFASIVPRCKFRRVVEDNSLTNGLEKVMHIQNFPVSLLSSKRKKKVILISLVSLMPSKNSYINIYCWILRFNIYRKNE